MNNYTIKLPQKSSIPLNATGYHDRTPTSPIETRISRITVNFAKINQNDANFAAHISVIPVQKIMIGGEL